MFDKLRQLADKYDLLCARMEEPATYSDPAGYARYEREARELEPLITAWRAYNRACTSMEEALLLMSDSEMKELAQEEYAAARADKERLEQEVRILLDLDNTKERFITDIFEGSIRIAATAAGSCIDNHIMTALVTNGRDVLTEQEAGVEAGSSAEHTGTIGEALARIDLGMERRPFAERIYEEIEDPSAENAAYLLISSDTGDVKMAAASELGLRRGGIYWICPVVEDPPEGRYIPEGIAFYEVRI